MSEQTSSRRQATTDMVGFAAPIFDLILRLKAGLVTPSNELRPQIAQMLSTFEQRCLRQRYSEKLIQVAKFGLAAFVDETVLTNNFPLKDEWEKYPFQLEYFGEQLAGEKFFNRLDAMMRQPEATADAVELYYVCMLLGFKGKYAVYLENELQSVIKKTADHLINIGKISNIELSPHWLADDQPEPPKKRRLPMLVKIGFFSFLGFSVLLYLVMFLVSSSWLKTAMDKLVVGN